MPDTALLIFEMLLNLLLRAFISTMAEWQAAAAPNRYGPSSQFNIENTDWNLVVISLLIEHLISESQFAIQY